jgi:ADP-heptose:LPS heptosyltransferase
MFYTYDIFQIKRKLKYEGFSEIFDLQTSRRSSYYLKLFKKSGGQTNGIGKYSTISHSNIKRDFMHTIERQKDQLSLSNIKFIKNPDLRWLYNQKSKFKEKKIALIVPGGSKSRLNKRIPLKIFFEITSLFLKNNITPFLIGGMDDINVCNKIKEKFPKSQNLCLKTSFFDIGSLAKKALFSVGNDTGPMHIISRANNKTLILFTKNSNPDLCCPVGEKVESLSFFGDESLFEETVLKKTKLAIS